MSRTSESVDCGSPAWDDVIVGLNGQTIDDPSQSSCGSCDSKTGTTAVRESAAERSKRWSSIPIVSTSTARARAGKNSEFGIQNLESGDAFQIPDSEF
jgi:hypothetical protein